jgi:hypothetical protein
MQPHQMRFTRTDIWREGKWLDLWSVVHFLSGVSIAIGFQIFGFGFWPTAVITFICLVAYELWEAMVKIAETPQNRVMDVVVGMVSFLLTHAVGIPPVWTTQFYIAFFGVLAINVMLATLGWIASQKAAELEKRMMARIADQRARLRARREARRASQSNDPHDITPQHGGGVA